MSKATTDITKTKGDLSDDKFCFQYWNEKAQKLLKGAKIVDVHYFTPKETKESGWYSSPIALCLEKGGKQFWVYPMRDDEGNDGGALGMNNEESVLPVLSAVH